MIKILFFIETLKEGGAEKVLCDLVNHMNQEDFQITVKTLWPCDSEELLNKGIVYGSVFKKKSQWNRLWYRITAQLKLTYWLYLRGEYDIECAYLEMGPTKVIASSCNRHAIKLAWVHCDLQKKIGDSKEHVKKANSQYEKYDRIVCVSNNVKDSFKNMFGSIANVDVIHNVVDDQKIKELSNEPLPEGLQKNRKTVISLGRLTYQKGYDVLLQIHKELIQEGVIHNLWIAGEGEDRSKLEKYIKDNNLEKTAKLLGYISNPYPLLKCADVLVCSSRYEGLSTFITEGLILGKAIVTTDCTGMRELLGDSEFGLISKMSEDSLKEKLKNMLCNDSLRHDYEMRAEERGESFRMDKLVEDTELYFKKIVKR